VCSAGLAFVGGFMIVIHYIIANLVSFFVGGFIFLFISFFIF